MIEHYLTRPLLCVTCSIATALGTGLIAIEPKGAINANLNFKKKGLRHQKSLCCNDCLQTTHTVNSVWFVSIAYMVNMSNSKNSTMNRRNVFQICTQ